MKVLCTAIAARTFENWRPALDILRNMGHQVSVLKMPHLADPDHVGLFNIDYETLDCLPIRTSLRRISSDECEEIARSAFELVSRSNCDVLLLTTCHAGPELAIARRLISETSRPILVGAQHGFVQNWQSYWENFHFDHFLVFGPMHWNMAPDRLKGCVHVGGLGRLDSIQTTPRIPFLEDYRPIIFAAQSKVSETLLEKLRCISEHSNRCIIVRPHPEFPDAFTGRGFSIARSDQSLTEHMAECSMLLTTGSTVVLEALVARVPVVVLSEERGQEYDMSGLVTDGSDPSAVLKIAANQYHPTTRCGLDDFLSQASGACSNVRAQIGAKAIIEILSVEGWPACLS